MPKPYHEEDRRRPTKHGVRAGWLKRIGVASFAFFFVKELVWLVLAMIAAWKLAA